MEIPASNRIPREDKVIVAKDPKGGASKFILHNPRKRLVEEIHPEEFIPQSAGVQKCDYLFIVADLEIELYIELKGNRLTDALKQLEGTLKLLKLKFDEKHCFAILNRTPSNTPDIQRERLAFQRRNKCQLTIKSQQHEYHLPK